MRIVLAVLAMLFIAAPALAVNDWTQCGSNQTAVQSRVGEKGCIQFRFNSSFTTSSTFRVLADAALLTFQPDIDAAGGVATMDVQRCVAGLTAAQEANGCKTILDSDLTGAGGGPSLQNMSVRIGPGTYKIEVGTLAGASDLAVVEVQGE